ncbi:tetratricopeptide repeat protein [Clostridium sp. MCC353]|uniref:tetratricopeptide repeat protein n=1 Tax=Clostridium sp. MCC353 TaxID=2592646 RepID=UPI001C00C7E9|nr:tetratricopeptide repeat protein [Clostridium sp. MCC353]MBT9778493.1 tetratricopeptide repeat protein [Clostridium sp. MCC353]
MKKIKKSLAVLSFLVLTTACSSGKNETIKIEDNQYYAGFQALDKGEWDTAVSLFEKNLDEQPEDITPYIGMARALIGAGELKTAKETLFKALEMEPETENALFYLGEVSQKLEDYDQAVICYEKLMELRPEDALVKERLIDNLWKTDDNENKYNVSLYIYEQDNSYLQNLLWACSACKDEQKMDAVLELTKDTDQYDPVKALFESYTALKNGDREKAETILFDIDNSEKLFQYGKLYYGECDGQKNLNGLGVGIQKVFGQYGAMVGTWSSGYWDGDCTAWNGKITNMTSRSNGIKRKGKRRESNIYRGIWQAGRPEGEVVHDNSSSLTYDDEAQPYHSGQENTVLHFANGGAQGETVTRRKIYNNYNQRWEDSDNIHHVFVDGKPSLFEIEAYDGKKEVYEAYINGNFVMRYEETMCDCSYIWK